MKQPNDSPSATNRMLGCAVNMSWKDAITLSRLRPVPTNGDGKSNVSNSRPKQQRSEIN